MGNIDATGHWIVSLTEADNGQDRSNLSSGPYGTFEHAKLVALFELTDRSENGAGIERREVDEAETEFRTTGGRWTATVRRTEPGPNADSVAVNGEQKR